MTHVVVAIIQKKETPTSYLLVCSKKDFGEFTGYFYPPAGHIEEGEDDETALRREVQEELGVNIVSAKKIIDTEGDIANQKTSWYLCDVDSYDFTVDKEELRDAEFFTEEDMKKMNIWPATKSVFERYVLYNN